MKAKLLINRIKEGDKETLGHGSVVINNVPVFSFCSLELPNLHNQTSISSIPAGVYPAEIVTRSDGKRKAILLKNVPNRSQIMVHSGNYESDIQGCILVGEYLEYINGDDIVDVASSGNTLNKILQLLEGLEFVVEIRKLRS